MTFDEMPINTTEIDQSLLDIDERKRKSTFAWNGQFSPQFVETVLRTYANDKEVVYDPFAGSGTVAGEAIGLGLGTLAVELNPAAYHMTKIREFALLDFDKRQSICQLVETELRRIPKDSSEELPKELGNLFLSHEAYSKSAIGLLTVLCNFAKNSPSFDLVEGKWRSLKDVILSLPLTKEQVRAVRSDARRVPFQSNIADLVLTSPPYINVMNYHQQYRKSVEALGYPILSIARSEFGSNRMNRGNRFLTVIEYAVDMGLALRETSRVLKPGHRLITVVGKESTVLGHSFSNGEIVWLVATRVLGMTPLLRQQRRFKNRYGKTIVEEILHFSNSDCQHISDDALISSCQIIARDSLLAAKESTETTPEREQLLVNAIDRYSTIGGC